MAKFNLDNYELVEDRLKKFWKDNPKGRINTDVVASNEDGSMVIVKAELFIDKEDDTPVSSGLAQETKGLGGFANNEAWLENCESSAIGRALANWKYQGNKKPRPTQEEMKKVVQETPKKKQVAPETGKPPSKVNANQLNAVIDGFNLSDDVVKQYKAKAFKQSGLSNDVESWSNDEMSKYLDIFEALANKKQTPIEEVFGDVEEIVDIPSGQWEGEPPTEKQLKTFNQCVTKATDNGDTELVKKAKAFLNSGQANKKNIFDWIDTETWSLKDGS